MSSAPVLSIQRSGTSFLAFAPNGGACSLLKADGAVAWTRTAPAGWLVANASSDQAGQAFSLSIVQTATASPDLSPHVVAFIDASGAPARETTYAMPVADLLEATMSRDGGRMLLAAYVNGSLPKALPGAFAVLDRSGRMVFAPATAAPGTVAAVSATPDLQRIVASHVVLPADINAAPSGLVRAYAAGKPAWSIATSATYLIASVSPDGTRVALLDGRRTVSVRDWGATTPLWTQDLTSVQSLRFCEDGSRIIASDYRTEQTDQGTPTSTSRFRLLDAGTGATLWDETLSGTSFYLPALTSDGTAIALSPVEPGAPAYLYIDPVAGKQRVTLPAGTTAACFAGEAIVLGLADGTVAEYSLPPH